MKNTKFNNYQIFQNYLHFKDIKIMHQGRCEILCTPSKEILINKRYQNIKFI